MIKNKLFNVYKKGKKIMKTIIIIIIIIMIIMIIKTKYIYIVIYHNDLPLLRIVFWRLGIKKKKNCLSVLISKINDHHSKIKI